MDRKFHKFFSEQTSTNVNEGLEENTTGTFQKSAMERGGLLMVMDGSGINKISLNHFTN